MGWQRRGMGCFQDMMLVWVDTFGFVLGWFTPQQKHNTITLFVDDVNDLSSKLLPSTFRVWVWLAVFYSEGCIEHEHTLLCPFGEVAMFWCFELENGVIFHILVNILERRWWQDWFHDAETQSMSLFRLVVGILTDDDNLNVLDGCGLEGIEDQIFGWVDLHWL